MKPTGRGDPYALRRAANGIVRIILENELRIPLLKVIKAILKRDGSLEEGWKHLN